MTVCSQERVTRDEQRYEEKPGAIGGMAERGRKVIVLWLQAVARACQ